MQDRRRIGRAEAARWRGAIDMLRLVRRRPGITRTDAARALHISSGSATEITARLRGLHLLEERPATPTGRGRPTTTLHAHPDGPVAAVIDIRHKDWRIAVANLEGRLADERTGRHVDASPTGVAAALRGELAGIADAHGRRLRAVSISIAATVQKERVAQASTLGWRDVDLGSLVPGVPQRMCNDANLAGLAEARHAGGDETVLYLTIEVGVGGVLVQRGEWITGATGAGGEFGHLPFGDPALRCPCGSHGCWDIEVDGRAMARHRSAPPPDDPRGYALATLTDPEPDAVAAVTACATAFGRGAAGLVNAFDPDVVALGGLAVDLHDRAGDAMTAAYLDGLMKFRRAAPPPLRPAALGSDAPLIGAAESAFDAILTESAVAEWSSDHEASSH